MAFNLRNKLTSSGLSRRSSSPLTNINDPIVTPVGDEVPVKNDGDGYTYGEAVIDGDDLNNTTTQVRERTIKGQEVEKKLVPEDFEGGKNNPEYQKKLAALKIAMEQGKDDKYKDQEIKQKRSYSTNTKKNVKTYPNPNTKNGMWGTNFEGSKKKDVTFDYAKKALMRAYKDDPAKGRRAVRAWAKTNGITLETAAQAKKRKASNKKIITTKKSESKGNWETL